MGFLTRAAGIGDMSKAIISAWVRVPSHVRDAIQLAGGDETGPWYLGSGVAPIIVFGPQRDGTDYDWNFPLKIVPNPNDPQVPKTERLGYLTNQYVRKSPPSYIGIDIFNNGLVVHLQCDHNVVCNAVDLEIKDFNVDWTGGTDNLPLATWDRDDVSYVSENRTAYFGNGNVNTASGPTGMPGIDNIVDTWHHILLSWDCSGGSATQGTGDNVSGPFGNGWDEDNTPAYTTAFSEMWLAIDDVAKHGLDLPMQWVYWWGTQGGPDHMLCSTCFWVAGRPREVDSHTYDFGNLNNNTAYDFGNPSATLENTSISSAPLYIPGPQKFDTRANDVNFGIELANVQVWAGQSLDVSLEINRRLFITAEGDAVDAANAAQVLGDPDVSFHAATDWISGTNTGIAGPFVPTGTILKSGGEPKLGT